MVSDERLLDFDARDVPNFDRGDALRILASEHGDIYRKPITW